ncbi:MAG TPA: rRNA maturation RNase YbeY [Pirellulales bacterium]|nr:rRNA maturation RNase YbeY [Pirellulales bacterium]
MSASSYQIAVANDCSAAIDARSLRAAVEIVLRDAAIPAATISIAVVDDATIRDLNARYLAHDDETDVLSFVLDHSADGLDGEIVVSADTAERVAAELDVSAAEELLLYVIHGALHLVGYDDLDPARQAVMRCREQEVLAELGAGG